MYNYILKVILLLSIVSSAYTNTPLQCGIPYGTISLERIIPNFYYFQTNPFTWIVSIEKINVNHNNSFCKGFLIHPNAVLTAAHCVQNESEGNLRVQATIRKKKGMLLDKDSLTRYVSKILIDPDYGACNASFNHAILRLTEPFPLNRKRNIICLSTIDQLFSVGYCGYTLININRNNLQNIPGKLNTCNVIDDESDNPISYMLSSCDRGKNNTDLILGISAQLKSCEVPSGSGQFYYYGMNTDILYTCGTRTITLSKNDNLSDNLDWINTILNEL